MLEPWPPSLKVKSDDYNTTLAGLRNMQYEFLTDTLIKFRLMLFSSIFIAPQSIPVNLGAVTGKLTAGSLSSSLFQDDKKNKVSPGIVYRKSQGSYFLNRHYSQCNKFCNFHCTVSLRSRAQCWYETLPVETHYGLRLFTRYCYFKLLQLALRFHIF